MTEETKTYVVLTCVGMRINQSGKLSQVWETPDGERLWYKTKIVSTAVPGQQYLCCRLNDNSTRISGPDSPVYQGRIEDTNLIASWEVEDMAVKATDARSKRAAKERDSKLQEMLQPVAKLYSESRTHQDARLLLAEAIRIITRG